MDTTRSTRSTFTSRFLLSLVALRVASVPAVEVSVCQDATYELAVDAASLCSGTGADPHGRHCPKAGDVAVNDCLSTLRSFHGGRCVSPEDAVCQVVTGDTWGCVLPSVGCNDTTGASIEAHLCETWAFSSSDRSMAGFESGGGHSSEGDDRWFKKTTELRALYNCGHYPTPAPTTRAHRPKVDRTVSDTRNQTMNSASGDNDEEEQETEAEVPTKVKTDRDVAETKTEAEVSSTSALEHRHEAGKTTDPDVPSTSTSADGYEGEQEINTRNQSMASVLEDNNDVEQETKAEARTMSASGYGSEQETEEEEVPLTSVSGYEAEQEADARTMSASGDDHEVEEESQEEMVTKRVTSRDEVNPQNGTKMPTPTHSEAPTVASTMLPTLMPVSSRNNGSLHDEDVRQVDFGELEARQEETGAGHSTTMVFAAGSPESFGGLSGEALAGIAAAVAFAAVVMTVVAVVYARQRRRLEDVEGEGEVDVEGAEDETTGIDDVDEEAEADGSEGNGVGMGKDESEGTDDGSEKDGSEGNKDDGGTRAFFPLVQSTPVLLTGRSAMTPLFAGAKSNVSVAPTATTPVLANTAENFSATASNDNALEGKYCATGDPDDDEAALAESSETMEVIVTDT